MTSRLEEVAWVAELSGAMGRECLSLGLQLEIPGLGLCIEGSGN